jgi:hypothetical protein
LLFPLTNKIFQVDTLVQEEMHRLRTTTQYELTLISLKSYHTKFVIIESLNTHSLTLHFQNIFANQNLSTFHILFFKKLKIQNIHTNQEAYNVISFFFYILSCYDQHGTIMFYDNIMVLSQTTSTTNLGVEFITTFNKNMRKTLYIITIFKPPKMKIIYFNSILETILKTCLKDMQLF